MKIIIDDKIPFIRGVLEACAEVVYLPGAKVSREDVKDADAIITRTRTVPKSSLLPPRLSVLTISTLPGWNPTE
jgi:erythronate-4-phosphate dehydrogenase